MVDYAAVVAMDPDAVLLDMYATEGPANGPLSPNNLGEQGFMVYADAIVAEQAGLVAITVDHKMKHLELGAHGRLLGRVAPGKRPFPIGDIVLETGGIGTETGWIDMPGDETQTSGTIDIAIELSRPNNPGIPIVGIPVIPYSIGQPAGLVAYNIAAALHGLQSADGKRTIDADAVGTLVTITEGWPTTISLLTAVATPA